MNSFRIYGLTILIALLVAVYTMTSSGKFHIIDEVSLFAVTESLAMRGDVDTNVIAWSQWVNSPGEVLGAFGDDGEVYSKKGPAPAFLALPWYLAMRLFGLADFTLGLLQSTLLWNGIVTALTAALLWLTAGRLGYNDRTGMALALLFGLATIAWPYANHFFGEPLSAFSLLLTFYGVTAWLQSGRTRWMVLAGVGAGLAIGTVTAHTLLIAILALYAGVGWWLIAQPLAGETDESADGSHVDDAETLAADPGITGVADAGPTATLSDRPSDSPSDRPSDTVSDTVSDTSTAASIKDAGRYTGLIYGLIAFFLPIVIAGALLLWYNQARFGNPFNTGYHFDTGEGFTTPFFAGFWGLVASPYRGLFWHTPLFFASLVGAVAFLRHHRLEGIIIAAMSVVLVGLYSMWWMWWGGFAWGPRFLVPMTPFWVLALAPLVAGMVTVPEPTEPRSTVYALVAWIRSQGASGIFLAIMALLSLIVQIGAVSMNYVNYEIELRGIFPTDWDDPLAFGPPAQAITDLQYSPVIGQFKLMVANLVGNTDLAWLWASGNIQWLIVLVGGAVLATLMLMGVIWWLDCGHADRLQRVPGWPVRVLVVILPVLLIAVWSGEVSHNPHYGDPDRGYRAVLNQICAEASDRDALVTIAPFTYQIPMNWLGSTCRQGFPFYGYAKTSLEHAEARAVLERLQGDKDRIWFVTAGLPVSDPDNTIERWLADTQYKADDNWYEDYRLVRYATPSLLEDAPYNELNLPLRRNDDLQITIMGARAPESIAAGGIMPVDIIYRLDGPVNADLRWFVQLISPEGYATALLDTAPRDGYVQFSTLEQDEEQLERAGLQIPDNARNGLYQLIAGLYDPNAEGSQRLISPDGSDFIELGKVTVVGQEQP